MSLAEIFILTKSLEALQELIKEEEMRDRHLVEYYKEKEQDYSEPQNRIEQYMLQRNTISEVIDIIDGLKVKVR